MRVNDGKSSSFPKEPISRPTDGISIDSKEQIVPVFGLAFPSSCLIGEIAVEMSRFVDAVSNNKSSSQRCFYESEPRSSTKDHVILVTDSRKVFETLSPQYNAVLFESNADNFFHNLHFLKKFHFARQRM